MAKSIYRRGEEYAKSIRELLRLAQRPELDTTLDSYKLALVRAVRERVTPRELKCMAAYYVKRLGMADISRQLGVNISTVSRNIHRGEGKNGKDRVIPIPPTVVAALKAQQRQQKQWRLEAGPAWSNEHDLVFTNERGEHLRHSTVYYRCGHESQGQ